MSLVEKRGREDGSPNPFSQKKPRPDVTPSAPSDFPSIITTERALQQALDFSALCTDSAVCERFENVGKALLHGFHLVVRSEDAETLFDILELEFYLLKDGCHEDPFTHGSEEQKVSGKWYFHRAPRRSADSHRSSTSLTAYRGGTRKGMDLTLGGPSPTKISPYFGQAGVTSSDESATRGGALLRSIRRVSDGKVISGPSLLVDEVLRLSKASGISDLVNQKWANDTSAFDPRPTSLLLRPKASPGTTSVYRSPRIGLDLSHPGTTASASHPRVVFLSRCYRYFTQPNLLTSNGRAQTFLGVLRVCLDSIYDGQSLDDTRLRDALVRITGLGESTATRYLEQYKGGVNSGKLKSFVGAQGKGASSSPATYLRMMGTLEQLRAGVNDDNEESS